MNDKSLFRYSVTLSLWTEGFDKHHSEKNNVKPYNVVIEEMTAAGGVFTPKELGCNNTYQIWLIDPDGIQLEVHQ